MSSKLKWCLIPMVLLMGLLYGSVITLADPTGFDVRLPFSENSPLSRSAGIKYKTIGIESCHANFEAGNKISANGADLLFFHEIGGSLQLYFGLGTYEVILGTYDVEVDGTGVSSTPETVYETAYSVGIQYYLNRRMGFGCGYHSIRGLNGCLSITFY